MGLNIHTLCWTEEESGHCDILLFSLFEILMDHKPQHLQCLQINNRCSEQWKHYCSNDDDHNITSDTVTGVTVVIDVAVADSSVAARDSHVRTQGWAIHSCLEPVVSLILKWWSHDQDIILVSTWYQARVWIHNVMMISPFARIIPASSQWNPSPIELPLGPALVLVNESLEGRGPLIAEGVDCGH